MELKPKLYIYSILGRNWNKNQAVFLTDCSNQTGQTLEESKNKNGGQKLEKPNGSRGLQSRGWKTKPGETPSAGKENPGISGRNVALGQSREGQCIDSNLDISYFSTFQGILWFNKQIFPSRDK